MEAVYFLLILVVVIVAYAYCNKVIGKKEYVMCVEAGPVGEADAQFLKSHSFYDWHRTVRGTDGKVLDTSGMLRVVVEGGCMEPRGIMSGDQLLVRRIDPRKDLREQIKHNDILLIYLEDTGISKIRIFDCYNDDDTLVTYRYEGRERRDSSRPQSMKSVVGVVKYKV